MVLFDTPQSSIIRKELTNSDIKYLKATVFFEKGENELCFKLMEEYISEVGDKIDPHFMPYAFIGTYYYYLKDYDKAIEYFEKLSLENDDKFLLAVSYAKSGMTGKAKDILWYLFDSDGYLAKARSNISVKKLAEDIEKEKLILKEEKEKDRFGMRGKRLLDEILQEYISRSEDE